MPLTLTELREIRDKCFAADDLPCTEEMCGWSAQQVANFFESGGMERPDYPRVWLTSDVHSDRDVNMAWARSLPKYRHGDVLIVAGDLSHKLDVLEETLLIFKERFTHGASLRQPPQTQPAATVAGM